MKHILTNMEDILNQNISGFHQYILTEPVHLCYVSRNLCDMIGILEKELLSETEDLYANLVHPADRSQYSKFIFDIKENKQTLSAEYRLVKRDETVIYVRDTVSPKEMDDGTLIGYSVLTDVTDHKKANENLQFLNDTTPCGFLKYTCEKQPKITYINQRMMDILRLPKALEGEINYLELYKENIFLAIPKEERRRFSLYLNRVYSVDVPVAGEMTVLRCDGTRAYILGWVVKCVNEQGEEEFQSVCMDLTQRHQSRQIAESNRYFKALTDVYDKIFEYDLGANIVKCLYSNDSPMFKWLENVPMPLEDATNKWITGTVAQEDCHKVCSFFKDFSQKKLYQPDGKPPQITFKAKASNGQVKLYQGIFLKMDDSISLYCCRQVSDIEQDNNFRDENIHSIQLKENMQEFIMGFTDGIAAFEITADGLVMPLYASDNVCEFFGYTKEEWLLLMAKSTPVKSFISHSEATYDAFMELLKNGEAEFTYFDLEFETEQHIKAICSQKHPSSSSSRYIMLYKVKGTETGEQEKLRENHMVSIRTFGYFDVFVGEKPIAFRNMKSKELFALLVDRRGGYISSKEAISFLWEDEPENTVTLARYRKVALRLKNILEEYGISDIVESVDGKRRIVPEKVQCDLYEYLSGKEECLRLFKGSYLTNYSWAETTLGELSNSQEQDGGYE